MKRATINNAQRKPQAFIAYSVLPSAFFDRPAQEVARDLLGKALVRRMGGDDRSLIVTETEAYLGSQDLACHAARGRTARTETMYGPPGTLYIYRVYGLHWMLNIVTGPPGFPAAVLVRSAGSVRGPGRLARSLEITGELNGKGATRSAGLWFEERHAKPARVFATPRIGVEYAGPVWSRRRLRFVIKE